MRFPPNERLSPTEAAAYLGVAHFTLAKWRMTGIGPPFLRIGHRIAYRIDDLDSWIVANSERASA